MRECVGTLDPAKLAAIDLEPVFRDKPGDPPLPAKMAERVHDLSVHIRDEYGKSTAPSIGARRSGASPHSAAPWWRHSTQT
jgi:hypothetical protein